MSRLLNSLQEAQREREGDVDETALSGEDPRPPTSDEPGYFWVSWLMLALICGVIVGGFLLLRDTLLGPPL